MAGLKAKLTKGAFWLSATGVLVNLTAFANTLLLARLLRPADFGLVAMATTITSVVISITELSLSSALVRHKDPKDEHFHSVFTLNLLRSAFIATFILAAAAPASRVYGEPRLWGIMVMIGASTLLGGFVNPKLILFSRNLMFRQDFIVGVSQKVAGFMAAAIVATVFRSYWALVASTISAQLTALALSFLLVPYRPRIRLSRVRELLSFSIWLSMGQVINTLNSKFDNLTLGYFLGNVSLGYYNVGDTLANLPTREATAPLAQTLFPGFVTLTDDLPRLRKAYQRAQSFLFAVALPAGCGFAVVAKPMIMLTIGPRWMPAVSIVQLLANIFALQTLASALQPLAMAMGETRSLFNRDVVNLMIRLPLVVLGFVFGGLMGVVYARCISGLANTSVNMLMVKRMLGLPLREQFAINLRTIASVIVMILCSWSVGQTFGVGVDSGVLIMKIVAMVASGGCSYVIARYLLWQLVACPPGPEQEVYDILVRLRPVTRV